MSRRYQFSDQAERDLRKIASHIRKDNPTAAVRFVKRLRKVCRTTLVMFPKAGTRRDDLLPGMRCFSVGDYLIYFKSHDPVRILRIVHGMREQESLRFEP
jgi:plasmid stabilization system protein ParE